MALKIKPTAVGILFTLGFAALPISQWEDEFASVGHLVGYELIWWAVVVAVLAYVRFAERRPVTSLGLRAPSLPDVLWAATVGVVSIAGVAGIFFGLLPLLHLSEAQPLGRLLATPLWWRLIAAVRAAVAEEVLFRGYALERLADLTGSLHIAAVISWLVFTVEHVGPWGWGHLLIAGFGGLTLTLLYVWRRNLWANIMLTSSWMPPSWAGEATSYCR
jgi:membrane protease YdiL (CAAX protease family)